METMLGLFAGKDAAMKKKMLLALALAGCCLLSGCAKTSSDDEVFGSHGENNNLQQTVDHVESSAPSNDVQDVSAAPETGNPEDSAPPVESAPDASPEGSEAADPSAEGATAPESSAPAVNSAAPQASAPSSNEGRPVFIDEVVMDDLNLDEEMVPMSSAPAALSTMLTPVASGTAVKSGGGAEIDYSNTKDGYVMARFTANSSQRIRVQVVGPTTTYTYDLPTGSWVTFPLSDGNGSYKTSVLQNTTGKKYAVLASATFQVTLADEFAPFLRPNQYVNYEGASATIAMAAQLTNGVSQPLDKVGKVYSYVVNTLSYDKSRAAAIASGQITSYLPDLDCVLAEKKGICFDYAALMTGMLRSQGVPCKMVVGWAGTQYHAWVSVWTQETGWVEGAIYFDGTTWQRMDPTFASSGNGSDAIMQYIGNGKNYTVKYLY